MTSLVSARGVSKHFGEVRAVDDVLDRGGQNSRIDRPKWRGQNHTVESRPRTDGLSRRTLCHGPGSFQAAQGTLKEHLFYR